jgi:hypothetical protein
MVMSGRPTSGALGESPERRNTLNTNLRSRVAAPGALLYVLIGIFVVTAASRLVRVLYTESYRSALDEEAVAAASNLAREGAFANIHGKDSGSTAHLSPLYPLLMAGTFRLLGVGTPGANLVNCCYAILAVAAAYTALPLLAARARLSRLGGLVAALLGILPVRWYSETEANWEQPCVTVVLVGMAWCFVWLHDREWGAGPAAVTGMLCGAAALFSAVLAVPPTLFAIGELASRPGLRLRIARSVFALAVASFLVMSPWVVRNYRVFGRFIPLRSNAALEFRIGNNPAADGRTYGRYLSPQQDVGMRGPISPYHPRCNQTQLERLKQLGEPAFMDEMALDAREWIFANPTRFVALCLRRFGLFWLPSADAWSPGARLASARALVVDAVGLLALCGMVRLVVRNHPYRWCFVATVFGPCLPYVVTHVSPRYTLPVYPLALLLACDFVAALWRRFMGSRRFCLPAAMPPRLAGLIRSPGERRQEP